MNHMTTIALLLNLSVAAAYAHELPVKLTFSGTGAGSPTNLQQPNTTTGEEDVAGNGSLGRFTFRNVRAVANSPQPSSTCSGPNQIFFPSTSGAGILRFQDGSLLKVHLMQGGDCIDLAAQEGHCTLIFQVAGGTGRFKNASGQLTYTETAVPVLADATNTPVLFTEVGSLPGPSPECKWKKSIVTNTGRNQIEYIV